MRRREELNQSDSWEESKRSRETRRSRIMQSLEDVDDSYFKCEECDKFLESWMESRGTHGVCSDCNQTQEEDENVL